MFVTLPEFILAKSEARNSLETEVEEIREIYERPAELAIEIGRVTGAASNFAIFKMENQRVIIC